MSATVESFRKVQDEVARETAKISSSRKAQEGIMSVAGAAYGEAKDLLSKQPVAALATGVVTLAQSQLQGQLQNFEANCRVLTKSLDVVAGIHPFVGVAVAAFKVVIALEMTRRSNDKRIASLHVQMQDLMSIVALLRDVVAHDRGEDGMTIEDRLTQVMIDIGTTVNKCGNVCDSMEKSGFFKKFSHSLSWEGKLAGFGDAFQAFQDRLHSDLALHASITIHAVDTKIDMLVFMRQLQDPRERKAREFIEAHGGLKVVSDSDELMERLQSIVGQDETITATDLRREMSVNVDAIIKANEDIFERKLKVQAIVITQEVDLAMTRQGDRIIKAIRGQQVHERLADWDVFELWKEMGWKGNVDSKLFVYSLREFYSELFDVLLDSQEDAKGSKESGGQGEPSVSSPRRPPYNLDDVWALKYLNMMSLRELTEALDADASSLITIKEINDFTRARPSDWSLLKWFAFWAIGFPLTIRNYYQRTRRLLDSIEDMAKDVLPANRDIVNRFTGSFVVLTVHACMAGIWGCKAETPKSDLFQRFEGYVKAEENTTHNVLSELKYNIDASNTVQMVLGKSHPEKRLLPVIHVLLRRAYQVIDLARTVPLHTSELNILEVSLENIFYEVRRRVRDLEATFRMQGLDPNEQFASYASGMYRCISKMEGFTFDFDSASYYRAGYDASPIGAELEALPEAITEESLYYGRDDGSVDVVWDEELLMSFASALPWRGIYESSHETFSFGAIVFINSPSPSVNAKTTPLAGTGLDADGVYTIRGSISENYVIFVTTYAQPHEGARSKRFEGVLNDNHDIICGLYGEAAQFSDDYSSAQITQGFALGVFALAQRPAWWFSSRHSVDAIKGIQQDQRSGKDLWRLVRQAVLYPLFFKSSHLHPGYLEEARDRRTAFLNMHARYSVQLTQRVEELDWLEPLDQSQMREFSVLQNCLSPEELAFFTSLSSFLTRRQVAHRVRCDICKRNGFRVTRITCLDCSDGGQDSLDFCVRCYDQDYVREADGKAHEATHPLLQLRKVLLQRSLFTLLDAAVAKLEAISSHDELTGTPTLNLSPGVAADVDAGGMGSTGERGHLDSPDDASGTQGMQPKTCAVCQMALRRPHWVCMDCSDDVYICDACNARLEDHLDLLLILDAHTERRTNRDHNTVVSEVLTERVAKEEKALRHLHGNHLWDHTLLRLQPAAAHVETTSNVTAPTVDDRIKGVEASMTVLQERMTVMEESIAGLQRQMTAMEQQLANVASILSVVIGTSRARDQ